MKQNKICVQCGESEQAIRKEQLLCGVGGGYEYPDEMDFYFNRHRFKPYSKKEQDEIDKYGLDRWM